MKDVTPDWDAIQVPDGTDWLEYMLNQPQQPSLQTTGVMNHISLGGVDMKKAQAVLEPHRWKVHRDRDAAMGEARKGQVKLGGPDCIRGRLHESKPFVEDW